MLKVIQEGQSSFIVVPVEYGTEMEHNGKRWLRLPLPICRVPTGPRRNIAEAELLAHRIARLLVNCECPANDGTDFTGFREPTQTPAMVIPNSGSSSEERKAEHAK